MDVDAPPQTRSEERAPLSSERSEWPWRKRLAEGVVIVLSILAAFAIDAWWDGAQERRRAQLEVASLRAEFEAVDRELTRAAAELNGALKATYQLAQLTGPAAKPITADSLGKLLIVALTINAIELPMGALGNLLSSGDLPILGNIELQNNLAAWPSIANLIAVKFDHLVRDRNESVLPVVRDLVALSPAVAANWPETWQDENHFAFDAAPLLASRQFENLMLGRWIGIQIAALTVTDAQKLAKSVQTRLSGWQ